MTVHTPTPIPLSEQIEKMVRARLNGLDVLGGQIPGREKHVMECDAILSTLRSHDALAAAQTELAAIRDFSDNNPIIAEARRWYTRLNKSELLDSTTATRVGILLCGLDAMNDRFAKLKAQNETLAAALEAEEDYWRQLCSAEELRERAYAEGWDSDPTGSTHISSAEMRVNAARTKANELRSVVLKTAKVKAAPRMHEFTDWMPIASAPRDGSTFSAACEGTGNVYDCRFQRMDSRDPLVLSFDFWALNADGSVASSLMPTHWRPKSATRDVSRTVTRIGPDTPDNSMVICPQCTSQFPAICVDDQTRRNAMEAALSHLLSHVDDTRKVIDYCSTAIEEGRASLKTSQGKKP